MNLLNFDDFCIIFNNLVNFDRVKTFDFYDFLVDFLNPKIVIKVVQIAKFARETNWQTSFSSFSLDQSIFRFF